MAKIKSTLDLVMERTKNLNMTEKDREKLQEKQNTEKARMWVQRYLGRRMDADELKHELEKQSRQYPEIRSLVCKELAKFLDPAGDNTMVLYALEKALGADPQSIRDLMQSYETDLKNQMSRYADQMISSLNQEGFFGSSLAPNLARNPQWQEYVSRAHQGLQARIVTVTGS
ncbi:MAG: hypothetical protein JXM72_03880 [Deltaproteobacteria bacterium]|nr:hypothetical protein [Deltaproteobacteria bacterium]